MKRNEVVHGRRNENWASQVKVRRNFFRALEVLCVRCGFFWWSALIISHERHTDSSFPLTSACPFLVLSQFVSFVSSLNFPMLSLSSHFTFVLLFWSLLSHVYFFFLWTGMSVRGCCFFVSPTHFEVYVSCWSFFSFLTTFPKEQTVIWHYRFSSCVIEHTPVSVPLDPPLCCEFSRVNTSLSLTDSVDAFPLLYVIAFDFLSATLKRSHPHPDASAREKLCHKVCVSSNFSQPASFSRNFEAFFMTSVIFPLSLVRYGWREKVVSSHCPGNECCFSPSLFSSYFLSGSRWWIHYVQELRVKEFVSETTKKNE